ncbi:MAG: hypothetical protein LBG60_04980 [Bifidobacteriaceae bacterium]|jgi:hypothetical protein|nr:hypothetical protein [Bifidobacteriaceae bacterium]
MAGPPIVVDVNILISAVSLPKWVTHDGVILRHDMEAIRGARRLLSTAQTADIRVSETMLETFRHVLTKRWGLSSGKVDSTVDELLGLDLAVDQDGPRRWFASPPFNADGATDFEDMGVASYVLNLRDAQPQTLFATNDRSFRQWFSMHGGASNPDSASIRGVAKEPNPYLAKRLAKMAEQLHDEPRIAYAARHLAAIDHPKDATPRTRQRLAQAKSWARDITQLATAKRPQLIPAAAAAMRGINKLFHDGDQPFQEASLGDPGYVARQAILVSRPRFPESSSTIPPSGRAPNPPVRPSRAPLMSPEFAKTSPAPAVGLAGSGLEIG